MKIDLDKLLQLAEAATPGPWTLSDTKDPCFKAIDGPDHSSFANVVYQMENDVGHDDDLGGSAGCRATAEYLIAVSPDVVAELVRRLKAAELDAARWRAFLGSARIKPQGSAGLDSDKDPNGNPFNGYAHMGLEIWTTSDRDHPPELLEQIDHDTALGRRWLTRYADVARAAQEADHG